MIFANETSDKGLVFKIYKQLIELNIQKKPQTNTSIKKLFKNLNRHFSKEDIQMANIQINHIEHFFHIIVRKMQVKTRMQIGAATMEITEQLPQKIKNRITL